MDLSVSNSTVIIALNNSVMRLNLMNPEEIDSKMIMIIVIHSIFNLYKDEVKTILPILSAHNKNNCWDWTFGILIKLKL